MKEFEILPHTADIKIRVFGETISQLFINALCGMFHAIGPRFVTDQKNSSCETAPNKYEVTVKARDRELLLVDFLSHALYLSDIHNVAFVDATIHEITDTNMTATVCGEPIIGFEVVEIKAVTYHDLFVKQVDKGWQAEIVFDI